MIYYDHYCWLKKVWVFLPDPKLPLLPCPYDKDRCVVGLNITETCQLQCLPF